MLLGAFMFLEPSPLWPQPWLEWRHLLPPAHALFFPLSANIRGIPPFLPAALGRWWWEPLRWRTLPFRPMVSRLPRFRPGVVPALTCLRRPGCNVVPRTLKRVPWARQCRAPCPGAPGPTQGSRPAALGGHRLCKVRCKHTTGLFGKT